MNIKKCLFIFIFFSFLINMVFSQENVLKNGDFEEHDDTMPFFWCMLGKNINSDVVNFFLDKQKPYSGDYCFTIENYKKIDSGLYQNVKVKPNTYYKLCGRIRSSGFTSDSLGAFFTVLDIFDTSYNFRNTKGNWVYTEIIGLTGKKQNTLGLTLKLQGSGMNDKATASFDDIRLIELEKKPKVSRIVNFYNSDKAEVFIKKKKQNPIPIFILIFLFISILSYIIYEYFIKNKITIKKNEKEK